MIEAHDHGGETCKAGDLIERVNEALQAVADLHGAPDGRSTGRIANTEALRPLVVHTDLTIDEAECLVANVADGAMELFVTRGVVDVATVRGLIGQSFLAGVFAGKDSL